MLMYVNFISRFSLPLNIEFFFLCTHRIEIRFMCKWSRARDAMTVRRSELPALCRTGLLVLCPSYRTTDIMTVRRTVLQHVTIRRTGLPAL